MAARREQRSASTEFEQWWREQWPDLSAVAPGQSHEEKIRSLAGPDYDMLEQTIVPSEAISYPPNSKREPADHSWDRRAAWLVYSRLRSTGQTLNESSDLFA